jgi:hypothetical protein
MHAHHRVGLFYVRWEGAVQKELDPKRTIKGFQRRRVSSDTMLPDTDLQRANTRDITLKRTPSEGASTEGLQGSTRPAKLQRAARASRACLTCRKQKTRCFPAPNSLSCLRCKTLALECSLDNGDLVELHSPNSDNVAVESRLENLEHNVGEILKILQNGTTRRKSLPRTDKTSSLTKEKLKAPSFGLPSLSFKASPFSIFGSLAVPRNFPLTITRLFDPQMVVHDQNIISLGIISEKEALNLLSHFRQNYNRWVSFPEDIPIETLLDRTVRRCSLLLTVCCCVSVRYYDKVLRTRVYQLLLQRLTTELNQSLVVVPQTIEFMQALAVLSIYASSLSEGEIVFDAWFYSSVALQHFITKDVLGLVMSFDGIGPVTEFDEITAYRVWNHLCLVHLVNCVLSGRVCILDDTRLGLCRRTLDLASATNFDGRMIAEITLQTIVYRFIGSSQSLESVQEELRLWLQEWGYLFDQPNIQFVEAGYHYGYFIVLYYWNYLQNEADGIDEPSPILDLHNHQTISSCEDEVLKEMVWHLEVGVESLLRFDDDAYFSYLSDQVHFHAAFSALMLIKIISILQGEGRPNVLSKSLVKQCLEKVDDLSRRFRKIAISEDDISARYADSIVEAIAVM